MQQLYLLVVRHEEYDELTLFYAASEEEARKKAEQVERNYALVKAQNGFRTALRTLPGAIPDFIEGMVDS